MSEPGSEPSKELVAAFYPYGLMGKRVGWTASSAAWSIEPGKFQSPRDPRKRWREADYDSFSYVLDVESGSRRLRMSPDVPEDQRQAVADKVAAPLAAFREALPYSEAERRWLVDTDDELRHRFPQFSDTPERVAVIRASEDEILSAGLLQVVSGRELIRLWWSWRRQTDEFTDQGSRDIAYGALRELGGILRPNPSTAEQAGIPAGYFPPLH